MPIIETSDGPVAFSSWSYRLQGAGGSALDPASVAAIDAGLVVVDASRDGTGAGAFTPDEVALMQGTGADRKAVLSYISIGEAEDFRAYWNKAWTKDGTARGALRPGAPDWLGPLNPEWPDARKVRYWDADWKALTIDRIEAMAAQGFDGAYLDIVDAYYFWAHEARARDREPGDPKSGAGAAARMIDFIVELSAAARAVNPDFVLIQQNAGFLLNDLVYDTGGKAKPDAARIAALHDAIAGIAVEDLYLRGGRDEDNPFRPDTATIRELIHSFALKGEFVLSVDYARNPSLIEKYLARAEDNGFIPYAAPTRELDRIATTGTGGDDTLTGGGGGDRIYGRSGKDDIGGGGGADVLLGNRGADRIAGEAGKDWLRGGKGPDTFVFAPGDGRDVIADFGPGDRIDLSAFDARYRDIHLTVYGDGTLVTIGDVKIVLDDVPRSAIDKVADFIL